MTAATLDELPDVLTVAEVKTCLRVGVHQAYRLIASGEIRSVRVGRAIRVPRSALVDFLERSEAQVAPVATSPAGATVAPDPRKDPDAFLAWVGKSRDDRETS